MAIFVLSFTVLILYLTIWFWNESEEKKRRPPGPFRLPIVGCLFEMVRQHSKPPFEAWKELFETYGPYASMKAGVLEQVVVTDFEMMKEIMASEIWQDRYFPKYMEERSFHKPLGIIFNNGEEQKELRRFTAKTLRDFGFGKNVSMGDVIADELTLLKENLENILKTNGEILCMRNFFTISVLNVLWTMVGSIRYNHNDEILKRLCILSDNLSEAHPIAADIKMAFPILQKFLPKITENGRRTTQICRDMQLYFRNTLEERRQLGGYKEEQKDYIDVLLKEIDSNKNDPKARFTDEQFIALTADLFQGGSETTSNTLEYAFLYMMLYPEIQKKVQAEIDSVVGRTRMPTVADRMSMPYTDATLLEVLRLGNTIPIIIRVCNRDTKIGIYKVKKGTLAVCNVYAWNHNPAQWKDPKIFNPEHFLDDRGKVINEHKITPFGGGRRLCLGEVLGKASLFVYFTTMLQSYNFELSPEHPTPTLEPIVRFTLGPKPYFARICPRSVD